jgi:hypothetical protein
MQTDAFKVKGDCSTTLDKREHACRENRENWENRENKE